MGSNNEGIQIPTYYDVEYPNFLNTLSNHSLFCGRELITKAYTYSVKFS